MQFKRKETAEMDKDIRKILYKHKVAHQSTSKERLCLPRLSLGRGFLSIE
jgi:hypothetical protein